MCARRALKGARSGHYRHGRHTPEARAEQKRLRELQLATAELIRILLVNRLANCGGNPEPPLIHSRALASQALLRLSKHNPLLDCLAAVRS
jgi:hypothetical protein